VTKVESVQQGLEYAGGGGVHGWAECGEKESA